MSGPFYDASESGASGAAETLESNSVTTAMLQDGAITLAKCAPEIVMKTTTLITPSNIVDDLVAGITIVPAPGAGLAIMYHCAVFNYTFNTAAYTNGSSLAIKYTGGPAFTVGLSNLSQFGASGSIAFILNTTTAVLQSYAATNLALVLYSLGAFTNPGTAAGTATIDTYYSIVVA